MSGNVLHFPKQTSARSQTKSHWEPVTWTQRTSTDLDTPVLIPPKEVRTERQVHALDPPPVPIDVLYPPTPGARADLVDALELLAKAIPTLERARNALRAKDDIQSDHDAHSVQLLLPDLFRCRTIGDGFASIINAIEIALVNRRGEPLNESQLVAILRTFKDLRSRPFVSFENAQQSIEELETVGLQVDPTALGELFDANP